MPPTKKVKTKFNWRVLLAIENSAGSNYLQIGLVLNERDESPQRQIEGAEKKIPHTSKIELKDWLFG